ncbi:hypothetical protein FZC76_14210 [Sutcliffiella horikoshii]|uniref:Uncharacterized protein n=1 Tax=Sutcliffiella horikoshii TaxID=79883 RepID=A0A5D4T0U3_9BACI|nr:hypothetical protein [Sutcliffiella horikoshii]TYS67716.1 hypothetical protein FZC76_14210 [Sutcliffiella horikoshii]
MKTRKIVIVIFMIFLVILLGSTKLLNYVSNKEFNGVINAGTYVGGVDIPTGTYDLVAIKGSVSIDGIAIPEQEKLLNKAINNKSMITVKGKGSLKMTPSENLFLEQGENETTIINNIGYYTFGRSFKEGMYQLFVEDHDKLYIQVYSPGSSKPSNISFNNKSSTTIKLNEGYRLVVLRGFANDSNDNKVNVTLSIK